MKVKTNYKQLERVVTCDSRRGALLQNKVMKVITDMGCTLESAPCKRTGGAQITLPKDINEDDGNGFTIRMTHEYFLPTNLNGIMAVLHELGHAIDCRQHGGFLYALQDRGAHNTEVEAWENAFRLAHRVGLTEFEELYRHALQCLWTYYRTEGVPKYDELDYLADFRGTPVSWSEAVTRIDTAYEKATSRVNEIMRAV